MSATWKALVRRRGAMIMIALVTSRLVGPPDECS